MPINKINTVRRSIEASSPMKHISLDNCLINLHQLTWEAVKHQG